MCFPHEKNFLFNESASFFRDRSADKMFSISVISMVDCLLLQLLIYDRWNNIPHYTQTEKYGKGPCEPSLTSYYAHHS